MTGGFDRRYPIHRAWLDTTLERLSTLPRTVRPPLRTATLVVARVAERNPLPLGLRRVQLRLPTNRSVLRKQRGTQGP
jgi:hypothetical protein